MPFEYLRIVAMNDGESRRLTTDPSLHCVCFDLSAAAPPGWANLFRKRWATDQARAVRHPVAVDGAELTIVCALDELHERLADLQAVVADTNTAYGRRAGARPKVDRAAVTAAAERALLRRAREGLRFD